jgi:hypothetical protein
MLDETISRAMVHKPKTVILQVFSDNHGQPFAKVSQVRRALQGRNCMARSSIGSRGAVESSEGLLNLHFALGTQLSPSEAADVVERLQEVRFDAAFPGFSEAACEVVFGLKTIKPGKYLYDLLDLLVVNASRDNFALAADAGHSLNVELDVFWRQAGAIVHIDATHADGRRSLDNALCGDFSHRLGQPIIRLRNADFIFLGGCLRAGL